MPATSKPLVPGDLFARHQTITGLRALADFLEAHPGVPVDEYGWTLHVCQTVSRDAHTDAAQRAEVDRIAALLGVPVRDETARGGHYTAQRSFGRIIYEVTHIPARFMAEYEARNSYRRNITLDTADPVDHDPAAGQVA
jgi:hypothetical protein